jgi:hypothetical protein
MRRREFVAGLGSAVAWPFAAGAQQSGRVRRIGVLMPYNETDPDAKAQLSAFIDGLAESESGPRRRRLTQRLVRTRCKPTSCPLPAEAGERRFGGPIVSIIRTFSSRSISPE